MGQKPTDNLCHSCDINCSVPLTANETRLLTLPTNNNNNLNSHTSCRMALLSSDWIRIIQNGTNARTLQEKGIAAWCKRVEGEYCTWGPGWL
jgi:hypothetical protein